MIQTFTYFASTTTEEHSDLLGVLGIDWRMLVIQGVAFLLLVWLLGKFVYPILTRSIDQRQKLIDESVKAAQSAKSAAESAETATEKRLEKAKADAAAIVATAQKEASHMIEDAETRAGKKAEHVLLQAEARIQTDMAAAREQLRGEMVGLVAAATSHIVHEKIDPQKDEALIKRALKEIK